MNLKNTKYPHEFDVCEECGGFGLIKKESETPEGTEDNSPTKKAGFRNGPAFFVHMSVSNQASKEKYVEGDEPVDQSKDNPSPDR